MTKIKEWQKVGQPKILGQNNGKRLIDQSFINPLNGEVIDYTVFDSDRISVIVFPLTTALEVISVKQFRPAIEKVVMELPGGNIDPEDKSIIEAARRELLEETGYQTKELIQMPSRLWLDPGSCTPYIYSVLALGCEVIQKPEKNDEEDTRTVSLSLESWIKMIITGEISDMKSIAITLLAMSYLEKQKGEANVF